MTKLVLADGYKIIKGVYVRCDTVLKFNQIKILYIGGKQSYERKSSKIFRERKKKKLN